MICILCGQPVTPVAGFAMCQHTDERDCLHIVARRLTQLEYQVAGLVNWRNDQQLAQAGHVLDGQPVEYATEPTELECEYRDSAAALESWRKLTEASIHD